MGIIYLNIGILIILIAMVSVALGGAGFTKEEEHDCKIHEPNSLPDECSKCENMPIELGEWFAALAKNGDIHMKSIGNRSKFFQKTQLLWRK